MWKVTFLLVIGVLSTSISADREPRYDYEIDSEGHVFEGYVFPNVRNGDRVAVSIDQEETILEHGKRVNFLRVTVRERRNNGSKTNFIVSDTDAFTIDDDNYIVINNSEAFKSDKEIEFYVVMVTKTDSKFVSNPIPFVVRMESKETEDAHFSSAAAIFAGVLVLIIVLFALLIPFAVRAKRRKKAGKPIFQLGSHKGSEEKLPRIESETFSSIPRQTSEPNWFGGNRIVTYEDEVKKEVNDFTEDIKTLNNSFRIKKKHSGQRGNTDGAVNYSARYTPRKIPGDSSKGANNTGISIVTTNAQVEANGKYQGETSKL